MDWLNKVKGTMKKTATVAYEKSAQLLEVTKLTFRISEEEEAISKELKNLGANLYEQYKSGKELDESIKAICEVIDSKYAEIENIKGEIAILKNVKVCSKCQYANLADNVYCAKCGEKLED